MASEPTRQVFPLPNGFFNDGYWYVLSSPCLGGSGISTADLEATLQSHDAAQLAPLMDKGVCLPLFFPGDCALDRAVVVVGDLSAEEQAEWLGRVRSKLTIPCGDLLVLGGGLAEDFDEAIAHPEPPDPEDTHYQRIKLPPGDYLVEVYAFVGSMTVNFAWEDDEDGSKLNAWWDETRPGQDRPEWMEAWAEEGYADAEEFDLLEYVIRLIPLTEEVPLPEQETRTGWAGVFEMRRPAVCPAGLPQPERESEPW